MHRTYALFAALTLLLTGCAGPATAPKPTVMISGPTSLSIAVASNDFPSGQPRVPFVLFLGSQPVGDAQKVVLTAFDLSSGTPVPGWSGEAISYSDYATPYWVVMPELPTPGYWGLGAVVTLVDGTTTQGQFTIETLADVSGPDIGEVPPAIETRTLATEPDLAKLTSDPVPEPALYAQSVAEAMASGRPSVIVFATPSFCESRLCAPVVDSVKAVRAERAEAANFIHVEIYASFDPLTYGPEMEQWGLPSEPWTFVLDPDGRVTHRFGGPVSPRELAAALDDVVAP